MAEDRQNGKKRHPRNVRVGWVLGGTLLFGLFSYFYTKSLSDIYCSEAILRVGVQTPAAGQFSSSDLELVRHLPSLIWRDVLTDNRLQDLGTKENFYPGLRLEAASGDLVRQMKRDIKVESVGEREVRVSCQSFDSNRAERLCGLVVSTLVKGQSSDKSRILESQIEEAESKLKTLSKQISDLNLRVREGLQEQKGPYFTNIKQIIQKLQANFNHISRLEIEPGSEDGKIAERQEGKKRSGTPRTAASTDLPKQNADLSQELEKAKQEQQGLRSQLAQYQDKIDFISHYLKEDKRLLDEYEVARQQYRQLLATRNQVEPPQAQWDLKGLTLAMAVSPSRPDRPSKPNRTLLNLIGTLTGAVVGLGFSLLLRRRKSQTGGPEELIRVAGLPVLARIPLIDEYEIATHSDTVGSGNSSAP